MTTGNLDRGSPSARVSLRSARADDAEAIASLHAASWRAHYRGSLSDAYLDGPIETERRAVWQQRLAHPRGGQIVLLAEDGPQIVGFVCAFIDHDREHGTFLDNLHVTVERKHGGIGRLLMNAAGTAIQHHLSRRTIYLHVLESNHAAQRFYDRIGGQVAERGRTTEPDGSEVSVLRYVWPDPAALIAGTTAH